ncbi:MAG: glycoside hydrolase family 73 protein [Terracidiphilus sp.]
MLEKETNYFNLCIAPAQAAQKANGVPTSVTLAQGALESGWLLFMPEGSNNPFGIKATNLTDPDSYVETLTHEWVAGQSESVEQHFERYPSLAEAFIAHASLLTAPRYAPAMAVKDDPAQFAYQIMMCGYSTNRPPLAPNPPFYSDTVMQIVNEFNLTQYDSSLDQA